MDENCNTSPATPKHISTTKNKTLEIKKDFPFINNITITANGGNENLSTPAQKQGQIIIDPQPLKLNVETSTDWPTVTATFLVGIGSILITSMVGWLSFSTQRMQIRSNIANFRNKWGEDLREASAQFFALITLIKFEIDQDPQYLSKKDSNKLFSDLITAQAKIGLMLDKKQPYTEKITDLLNRSFDYLKANKETELTTAINDLHSAMNDVLEKTWGDIKEDLRGESNK